MATGTIQEPHEHYIVRDWTLPSATITSGSYKEWTIDIAYSGYKAISINRATTNKSGLPLAGFALHMSTQKAYVFCRNVTSNSITCDTGAVTILYVKE